MRPYREITTADVGKVFFKAFDRKWRVSDFIGQILPHDVGKRVFLVGEILQVENDEQRAKRHIARKIEIFDERAYLPGNPKCIGTHVNVPNEWTTEDILERFGIGKHLTVYLSDEDGRRIIHVGIR